MPGSLRLAALLDACAAQPLRLLGIAWLTNAVTMQVFVNATKTVKTPTEALEALNNATTGAEGAVPSSSGMAAAVAVQVRGPWATPRGHRGEDGRLGLQRASCAAAEGQAAALPGAAARAAPQERLTSPRAGWRTDPHQSLTPQIT
jgi:hypothetical protein